MNYKEEIKKELIEAIDEFDDEVKSIQGRIEISNGKIYYYNIKEIKQ